MKRVVVPLELTKSSGPALNSAVTLSRSCDVELHLVEFLPLDAAGFVEHQKNILELGYSAMQKLNQEVLAHHRDRINKFAAIYRSEGLDVRTAILDEPFKSGISQYVEDHDIDLIVMKSTKKHTLHDYLAGNREEAAIERSNCPVLTVQDEFDLSSIQSFVVAVDFYRDYNQHIWDVVRDLSSCLGAKIYFLYVKTEEVDPVELNNKVYAFKKRHAFSNFKVYFLESDNVEEEILNFASAKKSGIIGMVTDATSGILRIFSNSTSENVVENSELPVLTINK